MALTGIPELGEARLRPRAHGQFSDYLGVPKKYYDRMLQEAPDLLCRNLNHWLENGKNERRLVRTLDGEVRAVLSDRYRLLDNYDFATAVLIRINSATCSRVQCSGQTKNKPYAPTWAVQAVHAPQT